MKVLASILILTVSSFTLGVVLEYYNIDILDICLVDYTGEGNSESDTSESAEDDSEKEPINLLVSPLLQIQNHLSDRHTYHPFIGYFMEIPNPPPEVA